MKLKIRILFKKILHLFMWFLIAFIGYFLLAIVVILDKFILTESVAKPVVYTFYSTIFMFGALLAWPFGVQLLAGIDWWWAIISGVTFGLGLWTIFIAIKKGEASHISPFNGAVITIATYLIASLFLGEVLTRRQIIGIIILVFATCLLSFEKSKKHNGWHIGFVWAMVSGILFAISHVTAKYLYEVYPFLTGFIWSRFFIGLVGLATLFSSDVRKIFAKKVVKKEKTAQKNVFTLVFFDKILAVAAIILIQYAAALGSVSLVMALSGLQFMLLFVMIYALTKFLPNLFKEYFTAQELRLELAATALVVIGSALFVI